jgi:RND superfamily putative drug exporter
MATAGRAVLFAGSIVVLSLFGLWASGLPFIGWIATAAATVVATLVVVALFVLPAVLRLMGRHIDRLSVPFIANKHTSGSRGAGTRWAGLIARNPIVALVLAAAVLGAMASPVASIRLGASDAGNDSESSTSRRAYDLLSEGFGPGFNGPILIVFDVSDPSAIPTIESLPDQLQEIEGVEFASPPFFNEEQTAGIMTVIPTSSPQDEATSALVDELREFLPQALVGTGAQGYVSGITALFVDIAQKMSTGLMIFIPTVLGLSVILLAVVFRSVLVPIKAALMIALSVGADFGVVTAVFQLGWGASLIGVDSRGPVESFLPMMLFAVLFRLSMDYEVFLVTRIHEEYLTTGDGKLAVERGHAKTFRVVIAAGLIMSSVFFAFILTDARVIKEFGLGLGVAILADALIVRMVLVPAIMHLMGNRAWWFPASLDRLLPRISVEAHPSLSGADGSDG